MQSIDSLPALLRRVVRDYPNQAALIQDERRVTWSELGARVHRAANAFIARDLGKGDRAALISKTSIEYVAAFWGALEAGVCVVPLPTMASSESLRLMMEDSGSKLLLASPELRERVPTTVATVNLDDAAWLGDAPDSAPEVELADDDDFNIIYSSGTTGVPKGIVHSHATRVSFTQGLRAFGFGPQAVTLVSTPLYSNTTAVAWLPSMAFGATQVLMAKFDAREALRLVQVHKVTHAMLVPVQYDRILHVDDFDQFDLSSFQVKLSTSAPLRAEVKRQVLDRVPGQLVEIYGLTEGGVSTILLASAFPNKLDSVGQPVPGCVVKVIDDDGNELPRGQSGEIVGRSGFMMKGYQNRPDATSDMLWRDADGEVYFRSGDIGRMDEDGFIYLLDRKKDMIISGGLNVFATDIEAQLQKHESVREVAVVGVPSDQWGETPIAVVVLEPNSTATVDELKAWTNERVGKHERVSEVVLRADLPKSEIGKVLKRQLRTELTPQ